MRAVIFRVEEHEGAGTRDVAGRPLLERQLQWLRGQGIDEVAVELSPYDADLQLAHWLLGDDPLTHSVHTVPSAAPLGPQALAARAGFDRESGVLELPAHVLCEVDLGPYLAAAQSVCLTPQAPNCPSTSVAEIRLRFLLDSSEPCERPEGWAAATADPYGALCLGGMVMTGKLNGPLVHAAEAKPGVWIARGAHVAEDVQLQAPVLIGAGAYVAAGATLGPLAVLGPGAVVERDATIAESVVLDNTVVGEGVQVRRATAAPHSLQPLQHADERVSVGDALVLDARGSSTKTRWLARLVGAVLALLLVVPWLLVATVAVLRGRSAIEGQKWPDGAWLRCGTLGLPWLDLWPRLLDVVEGRRFLLGTTDPQIGVCPAALDVGSRLAPGSSPEVARRMWRWYAFHKCFRLDRALLTRGQRPTRHFF